MFTVPGRVAERGDSLDGFFDVTPDVPGVVAPRDEARGVSSSSAVPRDDARKAISDVDRAGAADAQC